MILSAIPYRALLAFAVFSVAALQTAPAGAPLLSLLDERDGACEWVRLDPVGATRTAIAAVPGSCAGGRIAVAPDQSRAVIWFDPELRHTSGMFAPWASKPLHPDDPEVPRARKLYQVVMASGQVTELPFPTGRSGAAFEEIAYTASGELVAFALEELTEQQIKARKVTVDGQVVMLNPEAEGLPALAHAYRFDGKRWMRFQTEATSTGWDYAAGYRAVPAAQDLGFRSLDTLDSRVGDDEADNASRARLKAIQPPRAGADDGRWVVRPTEAGPLYVWTIAGEFTHTTGLIATGKGAAIARLPKLAFSDGEVVSIQVRGPYLLVAGAHAGRFPQLFDLRTREPIWSSQTARAATFFPLPTAKGRR